MGVKIEDKEFIPSPSGKLLTIAVGKVIKDFNAVVEGELIDEHGTFAIITNKWVLVAKSYIYGNIVSCHKRAVYSALNQNKKLLMYILDVNRFYEFEPNEIIETAVENIRGGVKMLNFDIRLGKRLEKEDQKSLIEIAMEKVVKEGER